MLVMSSAAYVIEELGINPHCVGKRTECLSTKEDIRLDNSFSETLENQYKSSLPLKISCYNIENQVFQCTFPLFSFGQVY